jgi:hypothetical protein
VSKRPQNKHDAYINGILDTLVHPIREMSACFDVVFFPWVVAASNMMMLPTVRRTYFCMLSISFQPQTSKGPFSHKRTDLSVELRLGDGLTLWLFSCGPTAVP